jgi:signal peptidase
VTLIRRILELVLVVYVLGVLGLTAVANFAPHAGYDLFAVRSPSMAPALGVGDLVVAERVAASDVRPGDVIAFQVGSGTTVTHRVVSLTATDDGPVFTTQGDANGTPDPVATRAEQLQGRLAGSVALLGFLLAMLAMPSGIAALFSIGAALLTAVWMLDEVADGDEDDELAELVRVIEADPAAARAATAAAARTDPAPPSPAMS